MAECTSQKQIKLARYTIVVLIVTILIGYFQVIHFDFLNYDDNQYITENEQVYTGLTLNNLVWAFTSSYAANWHPLTWISHMIDVELFGMNAGMHHLMNVLFHIANSLLLLSILTRMTDNLLSAAFVSFLFAIHPLHIQSVAWISERKDLLSTLFWMLTISSYISYVTDLKRKDYLLTILFYILGLMAKPMVVTLPFVLLLLDYWPLCRLKIEPNRSIIFLIKEKIPLFIFSGLSSVITYFAQKGSGAVIHIDIIPLSLRVLNALNTYVAYLKKTLYPKEFAIFYPYLSEIPVSTTLFNLLVLVLITFIAILYIKKFPFIFIGWFWYVGTCFPVIGLVQVGGQAMADRYTYIPLIGIFIIFAWGIPILLAGSRYKEKLLMGFVFVVISILTGITYVEVKHWKNSITLFEQAVHVTKDNYVAHENLGSALLEKGDIERAIVHIHEFLRLRPNSWEAASNLGVAYSKLHNFEKAYYYLDEALKRNPHSESIHNNMGIVLKDMNDPARAIYYFNKAIQLNPSSVKAYTNIGNIYFEQGDYDKAIENYSASLRIKPYDAEANFKMGNALAEKGKLTEAVSHFKKSIQVNSEDPDVHNNLGAALAKLGNLRDAARHFKEAVRIKPDPTYIENLNRASSMIQNKQ